MNPGIRTLTQSILSNGRKFGSKSHHCVSNTFKGSMKAFPRTVRCVFLFLSLCLLVACTSSPKTPFPEEGGVRVLFIGNSFTYWNDLPRTIADLAGSLNETPMVYQEVAKPDYSLEDHWFEKVGEVINQGGWNLVVMQQGPSSHPKNQKNLRYWTARYDALIKAAGARSALYQVWPAYRYRKGFTAARESYRLAALDVNGMFIPAGEAWRTAWFADSSLDFYGPDGLHPSRLGTYLVALVHFELIYDRPATDLPDIAIVNGRQLRTPVATVAMLQEAAHATVKTWGIR